jgi:hypothetical protein
MDFDGPDKNPDLGDLLLWHRKGMVRPGSRFERALHGDLCAIRAEADEEEEGGFARTCRSCPCVAPGM